MKSIKVKGFAAVNVLTNPPHIMVWSVAESAGAVRDAVGNNWPYSLGRHEGWTRAKRDGVRVRRVEIRTVR